MSLAILKRAAAVALRAPDMATIASWAASASNLLGAVTKGRPVIRAMFAETSTPQPFGELRPVPTAVPPCASS